MAESTEDRELSLVSKLEMRIALADGDAKLQSILEKFLAPLLLKLGSEHVAVRNKVVALCQHINTRVQSDSILLPVSALLKQLKEVNVTLVRHFDLMYIKLGLDRISLERRRDLFPILVENISQFDGSSSHLSIIFNLILRLLPIIKLPPKPSEENSKLREKLNMSDGDGDFLSLWFSKFLMLSRPAKDATTCPGLSEAEYKFLTRESTFDETWDPSAPGGLNLIDTKIAALKFISSGAFNDADRFIPVLIASADPNRKLADVADDILKRFRPDLESQNVVNELYSIFLGGKGLLGAAAARPTLRLKILSYLSKSVKATAETERIIQLLNDTLISNDAGGARGLEVIKLRQHIFTFISWLTRMGSASDLRNLAPTMIKALQKLVARQGWPAPISNIQSAEIQSRGLAYESIGLLAPKIMGGAQTEDDSSFEIDTLKWMFTSLSLDSCGNQVSVSIEQALGSILNSIDKNIHEKNKRRFLNILSRSMVSKPGMRDSRYDLIVVRSTEYTALRFANRCLPYSDVHGRCIDLLAIAAEDSGEKMELVEEGRKGLDPYWYRMLNPRNDPTVPSSETETRYEFPKFQKLIEYVSGVEVTADDRLQEHLFSNIFFTPSNSSYPAAITFFRNILLCEAFASTMSVFDIENDWERRLDAIITTNEDARSALRQYMKQTDSGAISTFLGISLSGLNSQDRRYAGRSAKHFIEIASLASNELVASVLSRTPLAIAAVRLTSPPDQDVAAQVFGMLASHPQFDEAAREAMWEPMVLKTSAWKGAVGRTVYDIRGALLSQAYLLSRLSWRKIALADQDARVDQYLKTLVEILEGSRDSSLRNATYTAIGQLCLASVITTDSIASEDQWKSIVDAILADAKKENEAAISVLGKLSLIIPKENGESPQFQKLLQSLYDLHEIRVAEVQFAVGEALSIVAVGWESKALITAVDVDIEQPSSIVSSKVLSEILEKIIKDCKASKPSLKKASVIWLLCLIQYAGKRPEIQERLRQCQATFIWLLSDRDEIVQESSSRGLSLVYELGNQDLKDDLVRDLVRSFTTENSNMGGGKISEDTELFEPGALPTGDGSVTTYKDIVGLASEVGDPSLVYRFMSLASNSAIWSSRAAFGRFGLSSVLSDSSVNGYLSENPKLYPKLYRYRFDPNPNVQRSMKDIWNALVKDSNAVIDTNFDAIVEDLLKSIMDGKQWRVRQASCAAIADLLQGRSIEKYDKYLGDILSKAFKALDDIKLSVRTAALSLCQTLSGLVLHSLESGDTNSTRAKLMLHHIVPFLLGKEGLESGAEDVQGYSILSITNIIKKAPAPLIRPFIPQILEKFLVAMSSIEPQMVNYVYLNAEKYGSSGQEIDKMRLSAIRSSPMMEAIELHLLDAIDESSMAETVAKLEDSLKTSIGLPSKVACSRVLVILSSKSILFRPYAPQLIRLIRKYVLDRNETVSASYSSAIGYLSRLASNEDILETVDYSKSLYLNGEDTQHRIVAGEILNSISKLANDRVQAIAASFFPFIFLGMHDTTDEVREYFDKTWKDNVSGPRVIQLYLNEILGLVSQNLESPRWSIKHASALSVATATMSIDKEMDLSVASSIWPNLEKALSGKTWVKKEKVLEAFVHFSTRAASFLRENEDVRKKMKVSNNVIILSLYIN